MKTLLSSMLSLNPSCCSETFCSTSKLNAKEQANMSVHEIWVGPGLTFFYKNLPSLQIFIFSSENGLTTTIRRWQHSAFDLNASACPKRLKSQYRYVLLLHIVLPCICMYCPLNLFEHSDEPRNCSKKTALWTFLRSIFLLTFNSFEASLDSTNETLPSRDWLPTDTISIMS